MWNTRDFVNHFVTHALPGHTEALFVARQLSRVWQDEVRRAVGALLGTRYRALNDAFAVWYYQEIRARCEEPFRPDGIPEASDEQTRAIALDALPFRYPLGGGPLPIHGRAGRATACNPETGERAWYRPLFTWALSYVLFQDDTRIPLWLTSWLEGGISGCQWWNWQGQMIQGYDGVLALALRAAGATADADRYDAVPHVEAAAGWTTRWQKHALVAPGLTPAALVMGYLHAGSRHACRWDTSFWETIFWHHQGGDENHYALVLILFILQHVNVACADDDDDDDDEEEAVARLLLHKLSNWFTCSKVDDATFERLLCVPAPRKPRKPKTPEQLEHQRQRDRERRARKKAEREARGVQNNPIIMNDDGD